MNDSSVESINENLMTGIELIAKERQEQIEKHGFTLDHDFYHETSENIIGAAIGAITADMVKQLLDGRTA